MAIINKKNFLSIVCVIYTITSIFKLILEAILGITDAYYTANLLSMFIITLFTTFIISLHYYLQEWPLPVIIVGQYMILMGTIFLYLWIGGHFTELDTNAYRDMFRSFTIPYVIIATVYYVNFHIQIKQANNLVKEIKEEKNGNKN